MAGAFLVVGFVTSRGAVCEGGPTMSAPRTVEQPAVRGPLSIDYCARVIVCGRLFCCYAELR